MFFYKAECTIADEMREEWNDVYTNRYDRRGAAGRIAKDTETFNEKTPVGTNLCISNVDDDYVEVTIISIDEPDCVQLVKTYLKHLKIKCTDIVITEITLKKMFRGFEWSNDNNFLDKDEDEIMSDYGIANIAQHYRGSLNFDERLIEKISETELENEAGRYLIKDTFIPELERIFKGRAMSKATGHPVHYFVETDDRDVRRQTYKMLLSALWANGRLRSRRYAFLDVGPKGDGVNGLEELYKCSAGSTIVIRWAGGEELEGQNASAARNEIEKICGLANRYSSEVLTIICLPRVCENLKSMFNEYLGSITMVEIKEEFVSGERAYEYLKMLAKRNKISPDKNLYAMVDNDETYLAPDLNALFDEWYNRKLKTRVYPQYSEFDTARKSALKEIPKGNAYDELQQMIGLTEAKKVIQQALDFFKMQQLYKDRGIHMDRPAMHMVFTGNPGTAKTTVARLFARIMKDNGVLSKGKLVEVGRSDLVGKYVGWTAQIVKKKFEEAMGSVLFIDEAYSLVDDKEGMFGDEAINTIVQEMENRRDDLIVVFAGYPDKMEQFLQRNPGLRSRIAFHVPFSDYDSAELCGIARLIASQKDMKLEDGAIDKLESIFDKARINSDFGNGRYVRNILEKAEMRQAGRILTMDIDSVRKSDLLTIKAEDIEIPTESTFKERRVIGFA